jgi:hypothetical protein
MKSTVTIIAYFRVAMTDVGFPQFSHILVELGHCLCIGNILKKQMYAEAVG